MGNDSLTCGLFYMNVACNPLMTLSVVNIILPKLDAQCFILSALQLLQFLSFRLRSLSLFYDFVYGNFGVFGTMFIHILHWYKLLSYILPIWVQGVQSPTECHMGLYQLLFFYSTVDYKPCQVSDNYDTFPTTIIGYIHTIIDMYMHSLLKYKHLSISFLLSLKQLCYL